MKSYVFAFMLILYFVEGFAQTTTTNNLARLSANDWSSVMRGNQPLMTTKNPEVELRGHPFVFEEWKEGSIILKDSSRSNDKRLKFKLNAEESEIWVLGVDKTERILTDPRIIGLELKEKDAVLTYFKRVLPEIPMARYVQIILEGPTFSLVKHTQKKFLKADYTDKGVAVVGRKYDSYEITESFYIIETDKKTTKIKLSKSEILKATATISRPKREEILIFCKENDISNPINEDDAAVLLAFIDGLK